MFGSRIVPKMVCLLLAGVELKIVVYPTSALIHLLPIPPALYCWPPSNSKLLQDQFVFTSLEKNHNITNPNKLTFFLKLIPGQFLFSFSIKEISKKSNCNCLAMPPHPHNFRRTICFPAFLPHRDQQAIKCDRESFKVFFTV